MQLEVYYMETTPPVLKTMKRFVRYDAGHKKPKLLLLDDEQRIINALKAIFRFKYDVYSATNSSDALDILSQHDDIAVVISDQRMPEMTGVDFLQQAKEISPNTIRILLTGFSDLQAIIGSINKGEVFRFLNKPWGNQEILAVVDSAADVYADITTELAKGNSGLTPELVEQALQDEMLQNNLVLIKCKHKALFDAIVEGAENKANFIYAANQEEAIEVFESQPIKVLVSSLDDNTASDESEAEFLKLLKQELPELIAIGLVNKADVDYQEIISLINEAKLYRYLILPCKPERLHHQINSAIDTANRIYANPVLLRGQSVVRRNIRKLNAYHQEVNGSVLSKIRSLKGLWKN